MKAEADSRPPEAGMQIIRAILAEAAAGIVQRPARSFMTALGTVIGVTVLVAVLALTSSASSQVAKEFDLQEATLVRTKQQPRQPSAVDGLIFELDSPAAASRINGVEHASLVWTIRGTQARRLGATTSGPILAATMDYAEIARMSLKAGRSWDLGHEQRAARVAVLGSGVASDLGIDHLNNSSAITIDGITFSVIGIVDDTQRLPELLGAVAIPAATALNLWGPALASEPTLLTEVRPGAALVVGDQLPLAISPSTPDEFHVQLPPDPQGLRTSIDTQLQVLFITLAAVCLGIGITGIANTTFIAVVERTGEIGLRRAMGASRTAIAAQFVCEAGLLGALGGSFGTALGVFAVVVISAALRWTAIIPPLLIVLGPVIGLISGALGGLLPALRASTLEPVDALRR